MTRATRAGNAFVPSQLATRTVWSCGTGMTVVLDGSRPPLGDDNAGLPVTVVTGFLGSRKTTLPGHILASQHRLKVAVIVNDIGEIGIDSELIIATDENMVELSNGCICCPINNDLVDAVVRVLERDQKINYMVVERTGLADPLPIIMTFLRPEFRHLVRLASIVAVPDVESFSLDLFDSKSARTNRSMPT